MMAITIEKGVPLPVAQAVGLSGILRQMEIGDSILLPLHQRQVAASTASRLKVKIATRKEGDGVRVWRQA